MNTNNKELERHVVVCWKRTSSGRRRHRLHPSDGLRRGSPVPCRGSARGL